MVERRTVDVKKYSVGRVFESPSRDYINIIQLVFNILYLYNNNENIFIHIIVNIIYVLFKHE